MTRLARSATVLMVAIAGCVSTRAAAAVLVVGSGDPVIDVPAVQQAVDSDGVVRLKGTFSFDTAPIEDRTILVTKPVAITGVPDESGNVPTITGGFAPFLVNAAGASVTFRQLRFVGAKA